MEERQYDLIFICRPGYAGSGHRQGDCHAGNHRHRKGREDRIHRQVGTQAHGLSRAKLREGYLRVHGLEIDHGEVVKELERRLKVADPVIKYLTVRLDEELKRQEKLKRHRDRRAARRPRKAAAADQRLRQPRRLRRTSRTRSLQYERVEEIARCARIPARTCVRRIEWQTITHQQHRTAPHLPVAGGPRPGGPGGGRAARRTARRPSQARQAQLCPQKKVCRFCVDKADFIDYKKAEILAPFIQERGKILPRRMTGTCARHQRWLTVAIKRAQNIALLPFAAEL